MGTWFADLPSFSFPGGPAGGAEAEPPPAHEHGWWYERIYPPESMREHGSAFARDEALEKFVHDEFTHRGGVFWDPEHGHLADATVGVVWSNALHRVKGAEKAGQMELLPDPYDLPKTWANARKRDWLAGIYGGDWPTFQMTLSGVWCGKYDDRQFFALIDHELCHAGVKRDEWGAPKFNDQTEEPVWWLRPHDHEGFVGTTGRWGAAASGAAELVAAGVKRPRFSWVPGQDFAPGACATCARK